MLFFNLGEVGGRLFEEQGKERIVLQVQWHSNPPHLFIFFVRQVPGSSPGGYREFEAGTASATYLFKYFIKDIKSNRMRIAQ